MKIIETQNYQNLSDNEENQPINPTENSQPTEQSPVPKGTEVWWRYGNYCGPGPLRDKSCRRLINNQPLPGPKDQVDQICMDHDLDYCLGGLSWKDAYGFKLKSEALMADKKLIDELRRLDKAEQLSWKQKLAARTIIGYFSLRHKLLPKPKVPSNQLPPSSGNV